MSKKIILNTDIARKPGMLYFVGTNTKGNLTLGEAPMARGGHKTKAKKANGKAKPAKNSRKK